MTVIRNILFLECGEQDAESESAEITKIVSVDASRSRIFPMGCDAKQLSQNLASVPGVTEVLVDGKGSTIYLKINRSSTDEKRIDDALDNAKV